MKNLANCKPSEFLSQTVKIRRAAEKWLTATEVLEIRKRMPNELPENEGERRKAIREQGLKNFWDIWDAIAEKHPEETLNLLALSCFIPPDEVDDHPVSYYMDAVNEMIHDEAVQGFFTLLAQLGNKATLKA